MDTQRKSPRGGQRLVGSPWWHHICRQMTIRLASDHCDRRDQLKDPWKPTLHLEFDKQLKCYSGVRLG
jgi:hypothetical protein